MKVNDKQALRASQFLKLHAGDMVLVHAKGVNLSKICDANGIPYRVVKGLYLEVDSELIRSSRNCVAVKRTQLARLKQELGNRSVSAASRRGVSHR